MLLGIDDNFLAIQPLDDKWTVLYRNTKPIDAEPANSNVNIDII